MSTDPFAPITSNPKYKTTAQTTNLILKEDINALTGGQVAAIKDKHTKKILYTVGQPSSVFSGHRRMVKDNHGHLVGQLRRKKIPGLRPTYYLGTKDNEKHCAIVLKDLLDFQSRNADIYLNDEIIGEVVGKDWKVKNFEIKIKNKVVAKICKTVDMSVRGFAHEDDYCMDILSEGVDTAFIAMITIALDQLYQDKM